jgi:YbbR domain-containing protein
MSETVTQEPRLQPTKPAQRRVRPRALLQDAGTLLLSLVLAVIIWLIAVNQENPLLTQELRDRVPVTMLGLAEGLVPVQDLGDETVKLTLRAPRNSWDNVDVADFRATIDLTGLSPGEHDVPVRVTGRDPQVTILDVQPPQLRVELDPVEAHEVPVRVEIMDGTAFGYDWLAPVYSPLTVTVRGPATQVRQVTEARAEVYLRSAKSQVERVQPVTPVDAQSRAVEGVTVEPAQVQIVVPVEQWPGRKEVAVRVKLLGRPAPGYRLSSVKVEPSTVVLQGEADVLSQVPGFVETEPLELTEATTDIRRRLRLILPEAVTSFEGDTVIATAGITPIEGGITVSEPLVVQGLGGGLRADSALDEVEVILSGPLPLLESLNQDDVFVILDLTGLLPGTHSVTPKVVLPDGIRLDGVLPETVEVVVLDGALNATPGLPRLPGAQGPPTAGATLSTLPAAAPATPASSMPTLKATLGTAPGATPGATPVPAPGATPTP